MRIKVTQGVCSIKVEMSCIVKDKGYGPSLSYDLKAFVLQKPVFILIYFSFWYQRNPSQREH